MADVHLLRRVGTGIVDHPRPARVVPPESRRAGAQRVRVRVGTEPGPQRGGAQREIDETGAGDRDVEGLAEAGGQSRDQLLRHRAGVELPHLGMAEDAVGLEVAVPRVGRPHFGLKGGRVRQARGDRGGAQNLVEAGGGIERHVHRGRQR